MFMSITTSTNRFVRLSRLVALASVVFGLHLIVAARPEPRPAPESDRLRRILRHLRFEPRPTPGGGTLPTLVVTGANLQIVNGLGATNGHSDDPASTDPDEVRTNGLGNLIVGYNEWGDDPTRRGSHNVVVGTDLDYSSFGGLVVGRSSEIAAPFASVSGGRGRALGIASSVSGGDGVASGDFSTITGGLSGIASGYGASVLGGDNNEAAGEGAVIVAGEGNFAGGIQSTVLGGRAHRALGPRTAIGGGVGLELEGAERFSACGGWACP